MSAQPLIDAGPFRLREFADRDVDLIRSASTDPQIRATTTVPPTPDPESARAYIDRQRGRLASGGGYAYAVVRVVDDLAVGYVGLRLRDRNEGRASLGYWIGPDHRGHGYAAEAVRALADWSDDRLRIPRLELYVEPWNTASARTAERAGFEREVLLRSWQLIGERRRDMWMYSRISGS